MARPNENIEGFRLVVVDSNENFNFFEIPKSFRDLSNIEDFYSGRGQLNFFYEDQNSNRIPINTFKDFKTALEECGTAQGLVILVEYSFNQVNLPAKYSCKKCMSYNDGANEKCKVCGMPRPVFGTKVFVSCIIVREINNQG